MSFSTSRCLLSLPPKHTQKHNSHTLKAFFFSSHFKPPEGDVISTRPGGEPARGNRSHRYFFFLFFLPLACLSLCLQRFKGRAVIYYYYYRAAGKFTVPALSRTPDGEVSRVRHSGVFRPEMLLITLLPAHTRASFASTH